MRFFIAVILYAAMSFSLTAQETPQISGQKADALVLYRQARDLEASGRMAEATAKYTESIATCEAELYSDPTRMDAYTVKCWSLFRLEKYNSVVETGTAALKIKFDPRIAEVIGEAYFFLEDDAKALYYLQKYIDNVGEYGDRVPSAYFYMAELYLRKKWFDHADIAYSIAIYREPSIARWWYRRGLAVEQLGDKKRALDLYTKALNLMPNMQDAKLAKERVLGSM